jgi:hypothetical protein
MYYPMHITMAGDHPDGAAPPCMAGDQSCRGCVPIDWQTSAACNGRRDPYRAEH